jgi:hypothetical protein
MPNGTKYYDLPLIDGSQTIDVVSDQNALATATDAVLNTIDGKASASAANALEAVTTANAASTKADAATETSQSALAKASTAQSAAESATQTAANASSSAAVAQETAAQANSLATAANNTATSANTTANALKNQTNLVNFYDQNAACWGGTVNVSGWYSPISHLVTVRVYSDGQLPSMPKGFSQTNIGTLPAGYRPTVEMRGTGDADVISGIANSLKIDPTGALTIAASRTADAGASYVAAIATYFVIPATQSVSALAEASDAVDFYENSYPAYLDASQQASALAHADALLRYEETIAELTARIEKLEAK